MKHREPVNHLEPLNINHSIQWVLVRGKNKDAPLLIHVQAGPGFPMISEANEMERQLHLEEHFLVAYWDQRGCGKSFSKEIPPETMNLSQMADDAIECTKWLLNKYNKNKAVIVGYSIGATITLMAAAKDSRLFSTIYTAGIDVDIPFANQYALDFAMNKARAQNNKKLIQKIDELKRQPIVETKRFQQRAEILTNLGGINAGTNYMKLMVATVKHILFSGHYGIGGLAKTMRGIEFCQNALIPEMNNFNLFNILKKVTIPVHFIQGALDAIAPPVKGKEFYEHLQAPAKTFNLFESSAHMPHYEQPEQFSKLIMFSLRD